MEHETDDAYRGDSLPLAYDQIKGLVEAQMTNSARIDTKASAMFTLATAMVGLTVPFVLSLFVSGKDFPYREFLLGTVILPVAIYGVGSWFFLQIYWLRKYSDINDPDQVKRIIKLKPEAAYESLYKLVEKAYRNNKENNDSKVKNYELLLSMVILQTIATVVWSIFVVWFSLQAQPLLSFVV